MSATPEREQAEALIDGIRERGQIVANVGQPPGWWCLAREAELDSLAAAVSRLVERAEKAERARDDAHELLLSDERFAAGYDVAREAREKLAAAVERERKLTRALGQADDLLRRLSEWDVLNLAPGSGDDGPYWQREIAKVREALAGGVSAAAEQDLGGGTDE